MKEKPILFNTEMVKAILAGKKTQTRRVIKPQPSMPGMQMTTLMSTTGDRRKVGKRQWVRLDGLNVVHEDDMYFSSPYKPGDLLWVRETWRAWGGLDHLKPSKFSGSAIWYKDGVVIGNEYPSKGNPGKWRPSIFMPKWASRITLKATAVRVERVQDIDEAGALAEGVEQIDSPTSARYRFAQLWDSINAKRGYSWESNPFVWVVEFEKVEGVMPKI